MKGSFEEEIFPVTKTKKNRSADIIVALCLLAMGFFAVQQYKTAMYKTESSSRSYAADIAEYRSRLSEETDKGKSLVDENERLMQEYDAYVDDYAYEIKNADLDEKLEILRRYRLTANLTDVRGEGISITMADAKARENADPSLFIIHDTDILRILNELKASGAQAIAINGERLLTVSEIMCAGPTVRVNRNRYPAPYIIEAVGNASVMASALEKSVIVELLKDYDISVKIERKSEIIIKKYYGSVDWAISLLSEVVE